MRRTARGLLHVPCGVLVERLLAADATEQVLLAVVLSFGRSLLGLNFHTAYRVFGHDLFTPFEKSANDMVEDVFNKSLARVTKKVPRGVGFGLLDRRAEKMPTQVGISSLLPGLELPAQDEADA